MATTSEKTRPRGIGLRTILVIGLAITSAFYLPNAGGGGQGGDAAHENAVAAIEKRGGQVFRDETSFDRPVIGVNLDETQATDDVLVHLKRFPRIQSLTLDETRVTDAGLANLVQLTSLTDISLDETATTDAGLAHLSGLVNLRKLTLATAGLPMPDSFTSSG